MTEKTQRSDGKNVGEKQDVQEDHDKKSQMIECSEEESYMLRKKNKTLISLIIILAGIAGGSFFIDIVQLFSGRGFSARALKDAQVVEYDGYTWARYDDPKIVVEVFDADDCVDCVTDDVLVRLRSLVPTIEAHRIDVRSDEGRQYAEDNDVKYIPAFLFDEKIIDADFYQQAAILFKDNGNKKQFFDVTSAGIPIGEYLTTPNSDNGILIDNENAPVTMIVYTDPSAENNVDIFPIMDKLLKDDQKRVSIVVKLVPDPTERNATKVSMAIYCAQEQNHYSDYAQMISKDHKILTESDDVMNALTQYAQKISMDNNAFESCMKSEKTAERIAHNTLEASKFGVGQVPQIFINGKRYSGVFTYQNIDEEINAIIAMNTEN